MLRALPKLWPTPNMLAIANTSIDRPAGRTSTSGLTAMVMLAAVLGIGHAAGGDDVQQRASSGQPEPASSETAHLPYPASVQTMSVRLDEGLRPVRIAHGDGGMAFKFPTIWPELVGLSANGDRIPIAGNADDKLSSRFAQNLSLALTVDFHYYGPGGADGIRLSDATKKLPQLEGKHLAEPRIKGPIAARLMGRVEGAIVELSPSVEVRLPINETKVRTHFVLDPSKRTLIDSMRTCDLEVELFVPYHARLPKDELVAYGESILTTVSSSADQVRHATKGAHTLCFAIGEQGEIMSGHESVSRLRGEINLTIDVGEGELDPGLVSAMATRCVDRLADINTRQWDESFQRIALLMPDGWFFTIGINELSELQGEDFKELEESMSTLESGSTSLDLKSGNSVGIGLISAASNLGLAGSRATEERKESAKRTVDQLRKAYKGSFKSLSGIDVNQLSAINTQTRQSITERLRSFTVGTAVDVYHFSLANVATWPEQAAKKRDEPQYPVGVYIVKSNGLIAFVRYAGNGIYIIENESGSATSVKPDPDGNFEAWGMRGKFDAHGLTSIGWLKNPQEAYAFYHPERNGEKFGGLCRISCNPEGGLDLVDEHGKPGRAVFSPGSRSFHVPEWNFGGSVRTDGQIQWPDPAVTWRH